MAGVQSAFCDVIFFFSLFCLTIAFRISSTPEEPTTVTNTTTSTTTTTTTTIPEGTKSYEGYRLLTVIPRTEEAGKFLAQLAESEASLIDFWQEPRMLYHNVTFSVAPAAYENLLVDLMTNGMIPHIITDNLQELLDAERKELGLSRRKRSTESENTLELDQYNRHPAINRYLDELGRNCDICEVIKIGTSHEGRDIKLLKIGNNATAPGIFIDAGIHAREWIAPATALYILNQLLGLRSAGASSRWLLDTYTWYILPVVNPDGYEYSWDHDRLWRKSRSKHPGNDCTGTDLNRNFDFHWREIGASSHSCAATYAGPRAFSEPESRALSGFLATHSSSLIGYITLHSYGQYWLTPWGFTRALPNDYIHLYNVASKATKALRRVNQLFYQVIPSNYAYYGASGGTGDWAKGVVGIRYTYTVELRGPAWEGLGYAGFVLPIAAIQPQGEEMWAGLKAMVREIYAVAGPPQPANIQLAAS